MKNILCIDDIETNLFTLQAVLSSAEEDYNPILAQSAYEGLDVLLKENIDCILLDIMMPDVDGFACAKMIKSNRKLKDIPIIFITAKRDDETISRCYKIGGDDYINKPFNSVELLARIKFHLQLSLKTKLLLEEKAYRQNILDLQENIVVVTNEQTPISVNKTLLDFYGCSSKEEFIQKYGCICKTFLNEEGYYSTHNQENRCFWTQEIEKLSQVEDVLVKIKGKERESIFTIKIAEFQSYYIVTLTDITQMSNDSNKLRHAAHFDELTQIYNRNMLHLLLDKKILTYRTQKRDFVLIMFDIDFFKKVNDTYGHLIGDEVLKGIVRIINAHKREEDIFARWGGEEFMLILDVTKERGIVIADELRKFIEMADFGEAKKITCSFGVTDFRENDTIKEMIKRADDALYEAKEGGRNRVCQK